MTDLKLLLGGMKYFGWKSAELTRGIQQLAHSYAFTMNDRWEQDQEPVPIADGDSCKIEVNDSVLSTGYIFETNESYGPSRSSISFGGRSKTADVVDCAAIHKGGQWRNVGLLRIAKDLCEPFGITVSTKVDLGDRFKNPNFKIQQGETAFACLNRAARMRSVLMQTDPAGNIVFDRTGSSLVRTVLEYGVNIKAGTKRRSMDDRFSAYTLKAQSSGNDDSSGKALSIKRVSEDGGVPRYRPTVILADNEASGTQLQKRADWERNVRAGRALNLTYEFDGWEHADGLWGPNVLVKVKDSRFRIDDKLLLTSVALSKNDRGTIANLSLTLPEAFSIEPLPKPKRSAGALFQ